MDNAAVVAALSCAETEIGHGTSREGATGSVTLGTLQGGLQPGYTADVAESPRGKSGEHMPQCKNGFNCCSKPCCMMHVTW
jgi:hypothetical protein